MTYTPKEWETGDIITATDLNNMEAGIADSNVLTITSSLSGSTITLGKTWKEINDAFTSNKLSYVCIPAVAEAELPPTMYPVITVHSDTGNYVVNAGQYLDFVTDSETGYPAKTMQS